MNLDTPIHGRGKRTGQRDIASVLFAATAASAAVVVAAVVQRWVSLPAAARVAIALFPVPFYAWLIAAALRAARQLDEMWARIQVEALAVTAIGTALSALTFGQLQRAKVGLPDLDWSWLWVVMTAFYALALARAARRYR